MPVNCGCLYLGEFDPCLPIDTELEVAGPVWGTGVSIMIREHLHNVAYNEDIAIGEIIVIDANLLNEDRVYELRIRYQDGNFLTKTVDGIVYDCFYIKIAAYVSI
jgi:hypothetical protein